MSAKRTSGSISLPSPHPLLDGQQLAGRLRLITKALSTQSDRALVLVGTSFLDEALDGLLRARFSARMTRPKSLTKTLFEGYGPLATFSAKIHIAYCLDLMEEWMYRDLNTIRKLRNTAAHSVEEIDFSSDAVTRLTSQLFGPVHVLYIQKKYPETFKAIKPTRRRSSSPNSAKAKAASARALLKMTITSIWPLLWCRAIVLSVPNIPIEHRENVVQSLLFSESMLLEKVRK